jgi:hypothetical protein
MAKNKFQALFWGKNRCVELSKGLVNENKAHCTETTLNTINQTKPNQHILHEFYHFQNVHVLRSK